jgi:excisionase family DNA binding protein
MNTEISVREAIQLTGYSRQQIYNLLIGGRVPARKDGHEYRIDRRALLEHKKSPRAKKA